VQASRSSAVPGRYRVAVRARRPAGCEALQLGLHEQVEVAVEDRAGVRCLVAGAQVLDHLVRVEHVAPDLVAPAGGHVLAAQLAQLLLALLQLELEEPGLEHPDRELTVLRR
jgi:hypothetical protein